MKKINIRKSTIIASFLILILVLGIMYVLYTNNYANEEEKKIRNLCEKFLLAYQQGDEDTVSDMLAGLNENDKVNLNGYAAIVGETIQYTVKKVEKIDENRYECKADIKSLDFPELAEDNRFLNQLTEDNILETLKETIANGEEPTNDYLVIVQVANENGEWKVLMDQEFSNALLGGYGDFYQQMMEEIVGEVE